MSVGDCFELGRQSYINSDYYHTRLWMNEAMDRLIKESNDSSSEVTQKKADILEYLAFSTYKEGNVVSALSMTNELLEINPDHERARGNKQYYEKEMRTERAVSKADLKLRGDDDGSDAVIEEEVVVSLIFLFVLKILIYYNVAAFSKFVMLFS